MHDDEFVGKAMTLTKTTARNAKDTTWRRVIGLRVDTLWGIEEIGFVDFWWQGRRTKIEVPGRAGPPWIVEDDVLGTVLPKARVGGAA